jgi:LPXTG-site transpeptidase (sortase) family protein
VAAELRFLDPPEAGARAVLAVTVRNSADAPSPAVALDVPADWFDGVEIIGAIPPVLDDRVRDDGRRRFDFAGVAADGDATLELHVVLSDDVVRTPTVRVALQDGGSLGELRSELTGAPPRPGPVRALSVPRLGIRTGVVDTSWEPPSFVAGQVSRTAALGEGNSVVVGHRRGLAGDVFAPLIGARLGDEVVVASRGVDRRYIVSEVRVLPGDDVTPMDPTETARLTLMTCIGAWNPLTSEYSHRLWVVAEPPELARATLTATIARAGHVAATSASPTEAARARTDAALARAAVSLMDARRPGRP